MKSLISRSLLIMIFTFLSGCNHNSQNDRLYSLENVSNTPNDKYGFTSKVETPEDLKIIKTGKVRYQVKNVEESTDQIKKIIKSIGGYISNLQFQNNRYSLENKFTVKIPQKYFDLVLDSINNSVEFIDYENISTRDVTEEYMDLEARLKTKLEVKTRYETILRKQAKTVKEILETEEKLGDIQEEIEAAQGKLKYLKNRVAYSTITIELYEKVEYKEEPISYEKSFWSKAKEGFSNGWTLISILAIGIINIWPLILFGSLLFFFLRRKFKKKSMNKN